jgi:hypothetical protein
MRPLGQTRPLLAYGVPAAAGLAVGGALTGQGEAPGTAVLGGLAGALGARGALGAGRLAGRYAPAIGEMMQSAIAPVGRAVRSAAKSVPAGGKRAEALGGMRNMLADAYRSAGNISPASIQKAAAGVAVPAGAALAGLGGQAAGMGLSAINMPGFAPGVDPELYGSSNSPGAQYKTPTLQYLQ